MTLADINQEISKTAKEDVAKVKNKAEELKDKAGAKIDEIKQNSGQFIADKEKKLANKMEHAAKNLEKHAGKKA